MNASATDEKVVLVTGEQRCEGRHLRLRLRRADLDHRFPGVLDAVIRG